MKTEVASRSDVGRVRDHNEDSALVDEQLGLYVVCDGMGGHAAGEVASELACRTVLETIRAAAGLERAGAELSVAESGRLQAVMSSALENANARVRQLGAQDQGKKGAGTTCTALLVRQGRAFVGHVGDSRLYLVRSGALHRISADHTLVEHAVAQGVAREVALAKFPSNPLVRAIGLHDTLLVDTLVFDVVPGDTFLLCSDGLHDYLSDQDELVKRLSVAPAAAAEDLVALANGRGGGDNITAVVLRLFRESSEPAAEQHRHERVQEDLAALWRMPLFNDMTYAELLEIIDASHTVNLQPEHTAVTEGEESDNLFAITHGKVRVERGGQVLAELGPGSHFGEMAVLTRRPRTATVRATEPTRLLAFTRPAIHALFSRRPAVGMKFLWTLAQVQSMRLDEAQVWNLLAEEPISRDMQATMVMQQRGQGQPPPARASSEELRQSLIETQQRFPPPLSRHH